MQTMSKLEDSVCKTFNIPWSTLFIFYLFTSWKILWNTFLVILKECLSSVQYAPFLRSFFSYTYPIHIWLRTIKCTIAPKHPLIVDIRSLEADALWGRIAWFPRGLDLCLNTQDESEHLCSFGHSSPHRVICLRWGRVDIQSLSWLMSTSSDQPRVIPGKDSTIAA